MTKSRKPGDHYAAVFPHLLVEVQENVRVVSLNAPDRLNSIDDDLHAALIQLWDLLLADAEAYSVVLTGSGRAFCAGGYLPNFSRNHREEEARRKDLRNAERLARTMMQFDLPVVAAVNGPAIGLGASLATMSDIVVMADTAFMADPHVTAGVVAGDGGAMMWPLLTSLLKAKEHLLLGSRLTAEECVRLGLANYSVQATDVMTFAFDLAERLARQPRYAVQDTKRALNLYAQQVAGATLSFSIATEREAFSRGDVLTASERLQLKSTPTSTGSKSRY